MVVEPPSDWEEMYDVVKAMRTAPNGAAANAAVDTMGCERLADPAASERDRRFQNRVALMLSSQTKDTTNAVAMGRLKNELPPHEDYDTLGGLVLRELGRIPVTGDAVEVPLPLRVDEDGEPHDPEAARLTVVRMDGLRVDKVRLEVLPGAHGGADRG